MDTETQDEISILIQMLHTAVCDGQFAEARNTALAIVDMLYGKENS